MSFSKSVVALVAVMALLGIVETFAASPTQREQRRRHLAETWR